METWEAVSPHSPALPGERCNTQQDEQNLWCPASHHKEHPPR